MFEGREEQRIEVDEHVTVLLLGNPDRSVPGRVVNVSRWGLRLAVPCEVASGTAVNVCWRDHFLVGKVRYGHAGNSGYQLGIQLLACSRWATEAPQFPS